MVLTSRLDIWADKSPCSVMKVDCLLPTGVIVPIQVQIDTTLEEIKNVLWKEARDVPLFDLLRDRTSYVFVCVNLQGKMEELVDETRQLLDVRPFRPILKLIERIGDSEVKLLDSNIGLLLGKSLHELEQMQNPEVDQFRHRYRRLVEGISRERSFLDWESRAMYSYPPDVHVDNEELTPAFVEKNLLDNRRLKISIAMIRNNKTGLLKDIHAFNVHVDSFPAEVLTTVLEKRAAIMGVECLDNHEDYILKIIGRESYLLGGYPLIQYQYIRDCIARSNRPTLSLEQRASLKVELNITGRLTRHQRGLRREPPVKPERRTSLSVRSINAYFKVKISSGLNINISEAMKVKVLAGIYHGNEALSSIYSTRQLPGPSPLWNELLEFDLCVSDIPRMARICLVVYAIDRKKSVALAWVNATLFDFRGRLCQGIANLTTWPVTETLEDQLNPIGTVVANTNTSTSPTLLIEFQCYANNVVYPPYQKIVELAADNTKDDVLEKFNESQFKRLKSILGKDPLCPIFELDKEFVWRLRYECREYFPHTLGKLLNCVKWNCKEDIVKLQVLLQAWSPLEPELALELLDFNYADQKVREFAVRCIDQMNDGELGHYLLQLVQVLKYESYLDCHLAKFLLKRALKNQAIGHTLFWLLKAEMHNPEVSVKFGLMLEAYLRGAPEHIQSLQKQVEALSKLKTITSLLYNVDRDQKARGIEMMHQCLQQKTYVYALSKLTSPLDPRYKLKNLRIEKCKYMDSKMKPLWLDFENMDELGAPVKMIFKNGDDLRQDMLTLQLIRFMDRIWKQNGLDLKMIPYGCLSTGNNVGMIQVVENAVTLANIQKIRGAITGALGKTCILDWLIKCNPKDQMDEVTKRFTLSCAGYCVATYVLGIGDRHSDNIMVTRTGQLFHIDFGHILGNFKRRFGIRRERVPVVLTDHFVHVITKGRIDCKAEDTEEYKNFKRICEEAFVILRRKASLLINLCIMMLAAGIPELRTLDHIGYLRKTLHLDISEEEAIKEFRRELREALHNDWKTSINWVFHNTHRKNT